MGWMDSHVSCVLQDNCLSLPACFCWTVCLLCWSGSLQLGMDSTGGLERLGRKTIASKVSIASIPQVGQPLTPHAMLF